MHIPVFKRSWEKSFILNTVGGKRIFRQLVFSPFPRLLAFSHFPHIFRSIKDRNHHFSNVCIVVCKCFEFGLVQKFVVRYRGTRTQGWPQNLSTRIINYQMIVCTKKMLTYF